MSTITTIKLEKSTKQELEQIKPKSESYNSAIKRLLSNVKKANLKGELIEAYKSMDKRDLKLLEEWDKSSSEIDYG